jgi:hypothetical protein
LRRLVFSNDHEGFRKLLDHAEALGVQHGLNKVVYGMEPTANYHKPLGEYLISLGRMVVLVSGVTVKRNRESLDGRWDKHDVKDSANVADLISQGKCLYYEHPSAELRGLRGLLSLKRRLKRQEQSYRVRIRNHLIAQYFPKEWGQPLTGCCTNRFHTSTSMSSPSQRLSLRGRSPSLRAIGPTRPEAGAEPEPEAERTVHPSRTSGRTESGRTQHYRKNYMISIHYRSS